MKEDLLAVPPKGKMMKPRSALFAAMILMASAASFAEGQTGAGATASGTAQASGMTAGEVRKIDRENKKITLKHGEIKNLEMPSMTMVFQVKDPAMLDAVKEGDKVQF